MHLQGPVTRIQIERQRERKRKAEREKDAAEAWILNCRNHGEEHEHYSDFLLELLVASWTNTL